MLGSLAWYREMQTGKSWHGLTSTWTLITLLGALVGGLVILEALCIALKKLIQSPRPEGQKLSTCSNGLVLILFVGSSRSDFGMPSSHTAFVSAFMMFVVLGWQGTRINTKNFMLPVVATAQAVLVAGSRVVYLYHTVEQVTFGAALGCVVGFGWFHLTFTTLRPVFIRLEQVAIVKMMGLRSSEH